MKPQRIWPLIVTGAACAFVALLPPLTWGSLACAFSAGVCLTAAVWMHVVARRLQAIAELTEQMRRWRIEQLTSGRPPDQPTPHE
jgi:hypothetical protein